MKNIKMIVVAAIFSCVACQIECSNAKNSLKSTPSTQRPAFIEPKPSARPATAARFRPNNVHLAAAYTASEVRVSLDNDSLSQAQHQAIESRMRTAMQCSIVSKQSMPDKKLDKQ